MSESTRQAVYKVLLATLRPIASILLRFGVNYQDFDRVCKAAFVAVATDEYGTRGKPANVSRVALMTGLTRKVVRRVRAEQLKDSLLLTEVRSLPSEVLNVWHTDFRFCNTYGRPKALTWDSAPGSFCELVRHCSGSVAPATMLGELVRVGAVTESENGLFTANRRSFIPGTSEARLIQGLQYGLRQLATTIAHNAGAEESGNLRFQRIVWNYCPPKAQRLAVDDLIAQRLREFSQEIDDLLTEVDRSSDPSDGVVVGVGLYQFEDDASNFRA